MVKPSKLTPMLKQYFDMKEKYADCILFFRLGDFYEMFGDDALEVSKLLSLTLTSRGQDESKVAMCGVPYHAARRYINRLTRIGKKIAICEQLSDPNLPGIVDRDVIKIITPGTTFDEYLLDEKSNNFLASLDISKNIFGLAFSDITTGEFQVCELQGLDALEAELIKLKPAELILNHQFLTEKPLIDFFEKFKFLHLTVIDKNSETPEVLCEHFKVQNLEGFGLKNFSASVQAASNLLHYVKDTQKSNLEHINKIKIYQNLDYMILDEATIMNLELMYTIREGKKDGALISVIDDTLTAMGGRKIRSWLLKPLIKVANINYRLNGVSELFHNGNLRTDLEDLLKGILDIERLLGKIGCQSANARDLLGLRESLKKIPPIKKSLSQVKSEILQNNQQNLNDFNSLIKTLDQALLDEPSAMLKEGGMIKEGYNQELDELKNLTKNNKELIQNLQQKEIARTGIQSLKVRFNSVFGYYIEISRTHLKKIPEDYMRRQTLVNAERFITPELKEYEDKILGAQEKIIEIEYQLFLNLRQQMAREIQTIQQSAASLATLDVLLNLARIAAKQHYVKPEIITDGSLEIMAGRHPVIETQETNNFVPNNVILSNEQQSIALITGPNMSGKSTYLRQTALIVLLAQIGSFVPADKAKISVIDRIFTRVGASDNLYKGQSTFMVEMQEAANILHNATNKSLIILDEIGRGTSTYDGLSIAWAIFEYLHDQIQAKTLFATHYHELIEIAEKLPKAFNLSVAVIENEHGVVFLHKVVTGGIDRSYGIEVAKLAGLPKQIIKRADEILKNLETDREKENNFISKHRTKNQIPDNQTSLFTAHLPHEHQAIKTLRTLNINNLTPIQALQKLEELQGITNNTTK
ncbi:DNA mismatch repair protein MutS [Candidatus Peregrinibacteria bacterium RIFOXYB2_FULL_33_20]|nr:MAG: DNA mismatch repair protein MutS [Candidatus Peregrinibacteria bacterium RIFOXYB2_FULL_33_20]